MIADIFSKYMDGDSGQNYADGKISSFLVLIKEFSLLWSIGHNTNNLLDGIGQEQNLYTIFTFLNDTNIDFLQALSSLTDAVVTDNEVLKEMIVILNHWGDANEYDVGDDVTDMKKLVDGQHEINAIGAEYLEEDIGRDILELREHINRVVASMKRHYDDHPFDKVERLERVVNKARGFIGRYAIGG
jgi:hypothetical protein